MNTKKIIGIVGVLVIGIGAFIGYRMYNKPHRAVEDEEAIAVTAAELFQAFETDEAAANEQYLDKVLAVTGKVSESYINQDGRTVILLSTDNLMYGIQCTLERNYTSAPGSMLTIKGICTGYLSDVILVRAVVVEKP